MKYSINTSDTNITFTVNGKVKTVPKNRVWVHYNTDTVTFLLIERYDTEGICLLTTKAENLEINGTTYTYQQLLDGEGISDLFSPMGLSYEIVEELPGTGEEGVIYLLPNEDETYTEYIWIADEERFELIGTTDVDLTNYYTKAQVDALIPTNVSDLTNDAGYITQTAADSVYATQVVVNEEIAARIAGDGALNTALGTKADKSDTYTKTQVDDALALKQDASTAFSGDYDDLTNKPDLSVYAESADLATVATSGSYNDLSDKPVIPESVTVDAALSDTSENPVQNKVVKGALDAKQDTISDLATIRSGAALGATAYQKPNDGIPASDLASGVIPTVPTNVSAFTNDAGYLTEHQSLANYYTKTQVDTALSGKVSQTEFDTKEEVISTALNELDENKQDKLTAGANITIDANNVISATIPDTSDFVTKAEYNPKEVAIAQALTDLNENKADKTEIPDISNYYTKSEIDAMIGNINTILASI